jgi:glycerol-3-phosphate O-acyltransferase
MSNESKPKSMTRRPEVGLNDECADIASRAFQQHRMEDPFFVRHWVFENAVAEAYQLGVTKQKQRAVKKKEISSFLYQASKNHIRELTDADVQKHGINITVNL